MLGAISPMLWDCHEIHSVKFLQTMSEHRAVNLFEKVMADFDRIVWTDSKEEFVERSVMDLAHR